MSRQRVHAVLTVLVLALALLLPPFAPAVAAQAPADVPASAHYAALGKSMMHAAHLPMTGPQQPGNAIDAACVLHCVTLATPPADVLLFTVIRISFRAVEGLRPPLVAGPPRFRPPIPSV